MDDGFIYNTNSLSLNMLPDWMSTDEQSQSRIFWMGLVPILQLADLVVFSAVN